MSDDLEALVARLRSGSTYDDRTDAADLIEAQAAEITRLRALCARQSETISVSEMRHGRILVGLERRNARQRRTLAKLYQRRHHRNALVRHLIDSLATARDGTPLNPDRWRGAINDALTGWMHPIFEDEVPKDALHRLIQHEITAALDPAVSQAAADLVATARMEGMKGAAKIKDRFYAPQENTTGGPRAMTERPEWPLPTATAEDTLRNVIRNCAVPIAPPNNRALGVPRWSIVSEVTVHGSTYSAALCRWAGLDPDELVRERK